MGIGKNKILLIVLSAVIGVVLGLGGLFGGSYLTYAYEKRALIILPGLFGSGLYDTATGEYIWDNFEGVEDVSFSTVMTADGINLLGVTGLILNEVVQEELGKIMANEGLGEPDSLLNMIAMNPDGTSTIPTIERVPWSDQSRWRYGVINAQKDMWESINARYGDVYDVQIFNYDFRKDTRYNADKLEEYIDEMKYKEVILAAHSNGGPVVATYLAKSEKNRKKVSKFVSYHSPLLGSVAGISILENVNGMIAGLKDTLSGRGYLIDMLSDNIDSVFTNQFLSLVNMWTPYQLLPSYEVFNTEFQGELAGIYLDGERMEFESQQELWEFYCTRPWAKLEGGDLRPPMEQWLESRDAMYVTQKDGSKIFSTKLVDTTYINGSGKAGGYKIYYVTNPMTGDVILDHMEDSLKGDGVVLSVSATVGDFDPENTQYFEGHDHYAILYDYENVAEAISYEVLDEAVLNSFNALEKLWYPARA